MGRPEDDVTSPTVELVLHGAILVELEARLPGFVSGLAEQLDSASNRTKVVSLRQAAEAPALRRRIEEAAIWLERVTPYILARAAELRRRDERKRRKRA